MKIVTVLLPNRYGDDRQPVPPEWMVEIINRHLTNRFGGCTVEGLVNGHWINPETGSDEPDESLKVSIAVESDQIEELKAVIRQIGQQLRQKAMFIAYTGEAEIMEL